MNADGIMRRPRFDAHIIRVGKTAAEAGAWALRQARSADQIESILRSGADAGKKNLLGSMVRIGGRLANGLLNSMAVRGNGYTGSCDPTDALYRGAMDPRGNAAACAERPEPKPCYDPNAAPKVYYNGRFPSKGSGDTIDEAIELLSAKKNLRMTKTFVDRVFEGFKLGLHSGMPAVRGTGKALAVLIEHAAFDRAHTTGIDMRAGRMAKLDTDAYIKPRIAFLLCEALKTREFSKQSMDSDIFEIFYSS